MSRTNLEDMSFECPNGNYSPNGNNVCEEIDCQVCCVHDDRDHGICLDCGDEEDPGIAIDKAMDYYDENDK